VGKPALTETLAKIALLCYYRLELADFSFVDRSAAANTIVLDGFLPDQADVEQSVF